MENKTIVFFLFLAALLGTVSCKKSVPAADEHASFITKDGVIMVGKFVPAKGEGKITFVLLHGLGSSKEEWFKFADMLAQRGYGYFAYDLRGHNQSNKNTLGSEVNYKNFTPPGQYSGWDKMASDAGEAVKYLVKKGISSKKIGLMGASLGANIALVNAADNGNIPIIVLLSPGTEYAGINISEATNKIRKRSVFIGASPQDTYAYQSSVTIGNVISRNGNSIKFQEGNGSRHGVQMFDGTYENILLDWLDKVLIE